MELADQMNHRPTPHFGYSTFRSDAEMNNTVKQDHEGGPEQNLSSLALSQNGAAISQFISLTAPASSIDVLISASTATTCSC
mmetsp:Transcript_19428/g.43102  ORF Transcript_19428/g.43102 Transcript_19428/m.43102 type:complete len:82 (+) Transcript_19428:286-531(+)